MSNRAEGHRVQRDISGWCIVVVVLRFVICIAQKERLVVLNIYPM